MKRAAILVTALIVAVAAVVGWRWWHHRPPFGPKAMNARATLHPADAAAVTAAFGPGRAIVAGDGDRTFLGEVTWTRPAHPRAGNSFWIVVLDKRAHVKPDMVAATSARPGDLFLGEDPVLDRAQARYPWLRGAGTVATGGGYVSRGNAVHVASVDAAPVTVEVVLPASRNPTDVLIALVSAGPDGQLYWAQRLLN
ncbi:hypothetical protein ACWT_3118 [Actinoplanes sp. SE50]|uniref:hypothetical protein n=1 Tax=unclassified Actinoplanes TaxID=2626549 RepID=UPI00023EC45F|nr:MULTISPECIES: hypothetical protein [unclassified Actinoplanes]AEV84141.1 hypothetical protein ACPL_3246 [Actinoplanes sp. SE50/110]ATO82533.1 hypothetical protein ACWT_3118 [Actinoplanes sp. SE50]SLL99940.1 hypothetical protein ACSP50_3172 [Actinoplanes sp. SE50/110]